MKKLLPLALMTGLILSACSSNGGLPTGSVFSADVGGTGSHIEYNNLFKKDGDGNSVYAGWVYQSPQQPIITFINHAGSVGAAFTTAKITIVDQNNNVMDLGIATNGEQVSNPYIQSFPARLVPGWACPAADGSFDSHIDPNSCDPTVRKGYERMVTFNNEGNANPVNPNQYNGGVVNLISYNVAERLSYLRKNDITNTFNAAMIVEFSGTDDTRRSFTLKTERIPLNIFLGEDKTAS